MELFHNRGQPTRMSQPDKVGKRDYGAWKCLLSSAFRFFRFAHGFQMFLSHSAPETSFDERQRREASLACHLSAGQGQQKIIGHLYFVAFMCSALDEGGCGICPRCPVGLTAVPQWPTLDTLHKCSQPNRYSPT